MTDSPFLKRLKQRARSLGERAVDELLASENRSDAVGAAVRRVQEGRRAFDENASRVIGAMGLATHDDLERVSRKVGRLRKRLNELLDRLDEG